MCCLQLQAAAQLVQQAGWGCTAGLIAALGNRFQRVGFNAQAYYCHRFLQGSAEIRLYRNFRSPGPPGRYNELVASAGILGGYGKQATWHNPFLSPVSNQTGYTHSVGYAYNLYLNRIKTTQQTGTISFQFGNWSVISENDIFARPTLDRFRTAALLVQYQHEDKLQLALNCTMWTGQYYNRIIDNTVFPYGYMDAASGLYTQHAHGLLSGQVKAALPYGQVAQANAGIDAEQVRNFMQNRLIHDMVFLPRKWHNPKNCHMPMVDTAGNAYLHLPDQKIKPVKPYWNLFSSPSVFY